MVLLLVKHGVHLPCILFVNFLLTLMFLINLVPLMSLRFLFWRKGKIGEFWKNSARFVFICRRCQCFIMEFFGVLLDSSRVLASALLLFCFCCSIAAFNAAISLDWFCWFVLMLSCWWFRSASWMFPSWRLKFLL